MEFVVLLVAYIGRDQASDTAFLWSVQSSQYSFDIKRKTRFDGANLRWTFRLQLLLLLSCRPRLAENPWHCCILEDLSLNGLLPKRFEKLPFFYGQFCFGNLNWQNELLVKGLKYGLF